MSYNDAQAARNGDFVSTAQYLMNKKLALKSAWWCPPGENLRSDEGVNLRGDTLYVGEDSAGRPTWEEAVIDMPRYRNNMKLLSAGRIDTDKAMYSHYLSGEWEDAANDFYEAQRAGRAAVNAYRSAGAGVITSADSSAIAVLNILAEVLGTDNRQFVLDQAVDTVSTPNLVMSIDEWKGFNAQQDVGEGVEMDVMKGAITRTDYLLKKDGVSFMITDEARMRSSRDQWAQHAQQAAQSMRYLKNNKIAVELETATDVAGGDWGSISAGFSATDPFDDIAGVAQIIIDNGGTPNTVALSPKGWRKLSTNSRVIGMMAASSGNNGPFPSGRANLNGFEFFYDPLKTKTIATVYDRNAVKLMQGPIKTAQYRIESRLLDAYMTVDFNTVKIVDSSKIRDLTGITTGTGL